MRKGFQCNKKSISQMEKMVLSVFFPIMKSSGYRSNLIFRPNSRVEPNSRDTQLEMAHQYIMNKNGPIFAGAPKISEWIVQKKTKAHETRRT